MIYLDVFVEEGVAEEIFANPGHAYTGSLLSAIPVPDLILRVKPKRAILEADVHSPLHLLSDFFSFAAQWPKRPAEMKAPIGRNLAGTSDLLSAPSVAISSTN
jgi:ABC-type oligopeptide transport system ATPase subunit